MSPNATEPQYSPGTMRLVLEADDIVALALVGEFDMGNASELTTLSDELLGAGKHLIVDLSEATFIDSYVIRALMRVGTHARHSRRVAVLQVGTAAIVERVLDVVRIERVIPRATNRSSAIRAIRQLDVSAD